MKHDIAAPLIGDLLHDRLDARSRLSVITHVVTCDDCRGLVDTYLTIWAGLRGDSDGEIHPSSESIVCYAVAAPFTAGRDDAWIKKHIERCPCCRIVVDSVQHAEETLALFEPRPEPDFAYR